MVTAASQNFVLQARGTDLAEMCPYFMGSTIALGEPVGVELAPYRTPGKCAINVELDGDPSPTFLEMYTPEFGICGPPSLSQQQVITVAEKPLDERAGSFAALLVNTFVVCALAVVIVSAALVPFFLGSFSSGSGSAPGSSDHESSLRTPATTLTIFAVYQVQFFAVIGLALAPTPPCGSDSSTGSSLHAFADSMVWSNLWIPFAGLGSVTCASSSGSVGGVDDGGGGGGGLDVDVSLGNTILVFGMLPVVVLLHLAIVSVVQGRWLARQMAVDRAADDEAAALEGPAPAAASDDGCGSIVVYNGRNDGYNGSGGHTAAGGGGSGGCGRRWWGSNRGWGCPSSNCRHWGGSSCNASDNGTSSSGESATDSCSYADGGSSAEESRRRKRALERLENLWRSSNSGVIHVPNLELLFLLWAYGGSTMSTASLMASDCGGSSRLLILGVVLFFFFPVALLLYVCQFVLFRIRHTSGVTVTYVARPPAVMADDEATADDGIDPVFLDDRSYDAGGLYAFERSETGRTLGYGGPQAAALAAAAAARGAAAAAHASADAAASAAMSASVTAAAAVAAAAAAEKAGNPPADCDAAAATVLGSRWTGLLGGRASSMTASAGHAIHRGMSRRMSRSLNASRSMRRTMQQAGSMAVTGVRDGLSGRKSSVLAWADRGEWFARRPAMPPTRSFRPSAASSGGNYGSCSGVGFTGGMCGLGSNSDTSSNGNSCTGSDGFSMVYGHGGQGSSGGSGGVSLSRAYSTRGGDGAGDEAECMRHSFLVGFQPLFGDFHDSGTPYIIVMLGATLAAAVIIVSLPAGAAALGALLLVMMANFVLLHQMAPFRNAVVNTIETATVGSNVLIVGLALLAALAPEDARPLLVTATLLGIMTMVFLVAPVYIDMAASGVHYLRKRYEERRLWQLQREGNRRGGGIGGVGGGGDCGIGGSSDGDGFRSNSTGSNSSDIGDVLWSSTVAAMLPLRLFAARAGSDRSSIDSSSGSTSGGSSNRTEATVFPPKPPQLPAQGLPWWLCGGDGAMCFRLALAANMRHTARLLAASVRFVWPGRAKQAIRRVHPVPRSRSSETVLACSRPFSGPGLFKSLLGWHRIAGNRRGMPPIEEGTAMAVPAAPVAAIASAVEASSHHQRRRSAGGRGVSVGISVLNQRWDESSGSLTVSSLAEDDDCWSDWIVSPSPPPLKNEASPLERAATATARSLWPRFASAKSSGSRSGCGGGGFGSGDGGDELIGRRRHVHFSEDDGTEGEEMKHGEDTKDDEHYNGSLLAGGGAGGSGSSAHGGRHRGLLSRHQEENVRSIKPPILPKGTSPAPRS
ncbi:unnamed protein product [Phaeothamnion confervicola]